MNILGVMTGTSCDALDAACLAVDRNGWRPLWSGSRPYPKALRERVLRIQRSGTRVTLRELLELDRDLGDWYGASIRTLVARRRGDRPDVISLHGQTVAHFPAARARGTTLQLGAAARVARATGLTVVSSFRDGDLAAGGEGAPLVPHFHAMLAGSLGSGKGGVAIHNIGGISNLTYVGPGDRLLAFDTGPGNIWIDEAAVRVTRGRQRFDRDGRLAASAEPDLAAVARLLRHPFFRKAPPKSTGRDDFPFRLLERAHRGRGPSLVATATRLTVESIAHAYEAAILERGLPLRAVYLCGGGARNRHLVETLRARLPRVRLEPLSGRGLDPQLIEAQAFALFGYLSLQGRPLGGPWTGARGFGPPGQVTPGENWLRVLRLL
jgi:anhydro-N-acetylmuramic acid kinase